MRSSAPYLLALTIPGSFLVSVQARGAGTAFTLLFAFGILPLLEWRLRPDPTNPDGPSELSRLRSPAFDLILWSLLFSQLFCLWAFLVRCSSVAMTGIEWAGLILSMGVCCGVMGINAAHEFGHRRTRVERVAARVLLTTSLYWQFYVEHNRGHHKWVATPADSETSFLGESLPRFWVRSLFMAYRNAWKLDPREMILGSAVQLAVVALLFWNFGPRATGAFVVSALIGALLLQSVNYIEHYGLLRNRLPAGGYEPVQPVHSWNSSHPLSRYVLLELSRHSDHHAHASRKYQILRHREDAPQLPAGYPAMILLALVPPLWFRVMNPRVQKPRIST